MAPSGAARQLCAAALAGVVGAGASGGPDCGFRDSYPRELVAKRVAADALRIDGRLDEAEWDAAPWSEAFVDIATETAPRFHTAAKVLWNEEFVFVAARLQEPTVWANISSTCHCKDAAHDQVIFHDNDFEVFVDPGSRAAMYKEFEVNALNATWDLLLNRPYLNGGFENSSRVLGAHGFDLLHYGLASAVRVQGAVNAPARASPGDAWTVEIALPVRGLLVGHPKARAAPGQVWRINFSRVEWRTRVEDGRFVKEPGPEDNWVWSKQHVVDMHRPERWGLLHLGEQDAPPTPPAPWAEWPARALAATVYAAQEAFHTQHGRYTTSVAELAPFVAGWPTADARVLTACDMPVSLSVRAPHGFTATVRAADGSLLITVDDRREFGLERLAPVTQIAA